MVEEFAVESSPLSHPKAMTIEISTRACERDIIAVVIRYSWDYDYPAVGFTN